ncbi:Flavin reductase like domain protein [compost metagenome]
MIMHTIAHPSILYFGTPVVIVSTMNENNTANLAPISSIFWLGWRCMIGLAASSKTTANLMRTKQCVLNLPSVNQVAAVNRLARTTGSFPVPPGKIQKGYRYEPNKFAIADLTAQDSHFVKPPRVKECPVQMEAVVEGVHEFAQNDPEMKGKIITFELVIKQVYLDESIQKANPDKVDPDKWRPLIMSFQEFYGLGERVHESDLAKIDEQLYQTHDREVARQALV